jgi:branched-chain amino acid transport system ATP-binding protein
MLEAKKLTVNFEKVEALKGISFHLGRGDFICLIGANGAGKTTTLRAISGLKQLASGQIWYQGEKINGLAPERIAKMGIIQVPEGRRIFSFLSVLENLMVGAYLTEVKEKAVGRLERVFQRFPRLAERRNQKAGSLSGGEQQMLAFGRALMADPKLLMLDEPTLGLSPKMVGECARFITEISREGVEIILVEQNARLALSISKRAYVLVTGSIVLEGESRELANSEYVKKAYLGQ